MDFPQQPDLFGVVHVEAQHVKPGARVRRPGGPAFTVTHVEPMRHGGILIRGKEHRHGGLIEIGGTLATQFEVMP